MNNRIRSYLIFLYLITISANINAQGIRNDKNIFFLTGIAQIKSGDNFGLVFRGPSLIFGFHNEYISNRTVTVYENQIGVDLPLSHKVIGANFNFKPLDFSVMRSFNINKISFYAGATCKAQYNVQFYPDLHSGYDFWLTNYSLGVRFRSSINLHKGLLTVNYYNSLINLVSSSRENRDPYYYDLSLYEVLKDIHSNFSLLSSNSFFNTNFSICYQLIKKPYISIGYQLDFSNYTNRIKILHQSIKFSIKI